MKNKILCLIMLLFISCDKVATEKEEVKVNEFGITDSSIGAIYNGVTIDDLHSLLDEKKVKKIAIKNPATNKVDISYYILDDKGKPMLAVSSEDTTSLSLSRISRIEVKDPRFVTDKGIGLKSTLSQITEAYPVHEFSVSSNGIVLYVPEINANFVLNPKTVGDKKMWDTETNLVIADSISSNAKVMTMDIFWDSYEGGVLSRSFWVSMLNKLISWIIIEIPSILILSLLFMSLLRLQVVIIKKTKKAFLLRAHKTPGIDIGESEKRINTLSGIIHGVGRIVLWTIFLLILLGKFNIDIAPILASAGIVGLAVGFGAQELVRDFISGFFILLEDQLRTGDMAIINGTTGLVEKIELRTVTLRDTAGVVHIFQNGKISTLSNMTKEWSAMVIDIGVAYKEDLDRVMSVMKHVGDKLLEDPKFKEKMIMPIEILGVDSFNDSSISIKMRIKTKPMLQWEVAREYRRLIKKEFDNRNIELPFPHVSLYWGEDSAAFKVKVNQDETK